MWTKAVPAVNSQGKTIEAHATSADYSLAVLALATVLVIREKTGARAG
jgi:hypothetical protein